MSSLEVNKTLVDVMEKEIASATYSIQYHQEQLEKATSDLQGLQRAMKSINPQWTPDESKR